ncbi:hypothetical protein O3Q52_43690 [Streptomyces sp. ActVer]|uniref:hypothetical protein n=1 Tax=Streptomyces sp. ActVer TaxID=3014558 RepID=UPI0022B4A362|nr:hypothetical protein [Streptomyces sp. ActVer]MCZ4514906.1 hypothetical protein [Streptomyces sp. ActVer]
MAEYEGTDALMAALTDGPLPEDARDDAEFLAEHRSALADIAQLREQLRLMGDTLAAETPGTEAASTRTPAVEGGRSEAEPSPAPVPLGKPKPRRTPRPLGKPKSLRAPKPVRPSQPPWYRRYAGVALGTLVVGAGTAMLGGMVWLGVQGGGGAGGSSDSSAAKEDSGAGDSSLYSPEMHLACSKVLVEGTVQSITPTDDGNVRVVLKVKRYYRPEQSVVDHPTITVTLLDSARADLKVGTYTLVRVPVYPQDRQDWETGWGVGDARKGIVDALPGARGMKCAGPNGG